MAKISTRGTAVRDAIVNRRDFDTHGSFWGRDADGTGYLGFLGGGVLNDEYRGRFRVERPTFVVFSYATPIAWWSDFHGWTVPPVKYSVTTSRHQSQVRYALAGI